jgi:hypothetical protein
MRARKPVWPKIDGRECNGKTKNTSIIMVSKLVSLDSSVCRATSYGLDDRGLGVQISVGSRMFSSSRLPGRLWGPPSFLSNGYWWPFPQHLSGRSVKLTTHLPLVQRSRKYRSIHTLTRTSLWRSV